MQPTRLLSQTQELLTDLGWRVLSAIAVLMIGLWLAKNLRAALNRAMRHRAVDATLVSFAANSAYVALVTFAVISALGQLGIDTASLIALMGTAGLAVGLALQGSLSNFAAGILIVVFRPFRLGDYIEGGGSAGYVREIQFLNTVLETYQNHRVIVPNSKLLQDKIVNQSNGPAIRMDLKLSVADRESIADVRAAIAAELAAQPLILAQPEPVIGVSSFTAEGLEWAVQVWITGPNDYWPAYFSVIEALKHRFDEDGIALPIQQREIRNVSATEPASQPGDLAIDRSALAAYLAERSQPSPPPPNLPSV